MNDSKIFFTADTHFYHGNIIRFCDRPFAVKKNEDGYVYKRPSDILQQNVNMVSTDRLCNQVIVDAKKMNQHIINNWNKTIRPHDIVYHLGDFALGSKDLISPLLERLNGRKILIKGNHDRSSGFMRDAGFEIVVKQLKINIGNINIFLSHKPVSKEKFAKWEGTDIQLCGHIHDSWRYNGSMINVGVDVWNFTPVTLEQILTSAKQRG